MMKTKMSILWIAVAVVTVGCVKRPYSPAGGPGPLDVSGFYDMSESLYSNSCGAGVFPRKETVRIRVDHTPGSGIARITVDDRAIYDAAVRSNGEFTTAPAKGGDTRASYTRTIVGNFTATAMYARVSVDTIRPLVATGRSVGPGDQAIRDCKYQLRWDAKKL